MTTNSLADLRQALVESFNLNELQELSFTLSVNYQSLPGENTLENKTQELITYLSRRGRLPELVSICRQQRPNIRWDDLISSAAKSQISVFISHVSQDREIADIIAQTLNRISLRQLTIAMSSDITSAGGMVPVSNWLNEIRGQLQQSHIVVPLLTAVSLETSWIYFESGFGAAHPSCKLLPLAIGIDCSEDVPLPLAMYRCYQLFEYDSFKRFIQRILNTFNVNFDEEMTKSILQNAIDKISALSENTEQTNSKQKSNRDVYTILDEVKEHIDRRLLALTKKQTEEEPYSIVIEVKFPDLKKTLVLDFLPENTYVQDILNRIYFELEDKVVPFTYMQDWVLKDNRTGMPLIIGDIASFVPAKYVFQRSHVTQWEAERLKSPIVPRVKSSKLIR